MIVDIIKYLYLIYIKLFFRKRIIIGDNSKISVNKFKLRKGTHIQIGCDSMIQADIYFDRNDAQVIIGNRTFIGGSKLICASKIVIGDDVLMSWGCTIVDHDSHSTKFSERKNDVLNWKDGKKEWNNIAISPVNIGNKAWIGFDVKILKGVTIGEGAVIAAGSLVNRDVEPFVMVGGIPAKFIKNVNEINNNSVI